MNNPFTLSFGKKPLQYISRLSQTQQILETFQAPVPSNQIFMITGVRGSGKTVMMTNIAHELKADDSWIVIELNPTRDLLQSLAAKIYSLPEMHARFLNARLDFSAFGLGLSVENSAPATDIENVLELMLDQIKESGKRLLITIDEVTCSEYIRIFVSSFQIFLRQEQPIFLLMTGLYENLYDLQNDKSLTFLYRAPKLLLEPLNYTAERNHYMKIFNIDTESPIIEILKDEESKNIMNELIDLVEHGEINEAENMLFQLIESKDERYLQIALLFYYFLNEKSNEFLENHNFNRDEIRMGLKDVMRRYKLKGFEKLYL